MVLENIHSKTEWIERKATPFRVLILFLRIGIFFFLCKFLPPPFLTAKYNFLITAIFCSGNGTGMIYFFNLISFLPLVGMLLLSQLSLLLVSCLTDFQGTGCTYQRQKSSIRCFSALILRPCSLRHPAIKHRVSEVVQYISALVRAAGCTFKISDLMTGKQIDIHTNKNLPISPVAVLPAEGATLKKKTFQDARFSL